MEKKWNGNETNNSCKPTQNKKEYQTWHQGTCANMQNIQRKPICS